MAFGFKGYGCDWTDCFCAKHLGVVVLGGEVYHSIIIGTIDVEDPHEGYVRPVYTSVLLSEKEFQRSPYLINLLLTQDEVMMKLGDWIDKQEKKAPAKTIIEMEFQTSGSSDIFSCGIEAKHDEAQIFEQHGISVDSNYAGEIEGDFNCLIIEFEEHWEFLQLVFEVQPSALNKHYRMTFTERPKIGDSPTRAGGFSFMHPDVVCEVVDLNAPSSKVSGIRLVNSYRR